MIKKEHGLVNDFIAKFIGNTDIVFTAGCCYWFAYILQARFADSGAKIMYDAINNHFATLVNDRVYDITGDVTDCGNWLAWSEFSDCYERERIIHDCIYLLDDVRD